MERSPELPRIIVLPVPELRPRRKIVKPLKDPYYLPLRLERYERKAA